MVMAGVFKSQCLFQESDLRCSNGHWITGTVSSFWQGGFAGVLCIRFSSTITLHVPWSLLLRWNAKETEDPLCFASSRHTLSILLLSQPTQAERIFCAVSDLHIKTCSVQKRELMSCLLCAILSDINRSGCMKGLYVTKGSNGNFWIMWNIMKGTVGGFFKQHFCCTGFSPLPALSGF